ncbi:MAG TPA: hypothetical protein VIQ74_07090 [Gemmatimonadaceae bacterium]
MPDYSIFGGCLRSEIAFPELREMPAAQATWTLRARATAEERVDARLLGELEISPECRVRLFKHQTGYSFEYDDTGVYDISDDGRHITWRAGPKPDPSAVRADVTGRVLAMALHAAGLLCLHGSAVSLGDGTVAFIAPKFHGKSTLALALARAGGRLVTDDVFPVEPGPPARAIPGVHHVKLWNDSAELFEVEQRNARPGDKHLLHELPDEWLMFQPDSLSAIYLLSPATAESPMAEGARRVPMPAVPSALSLVRHAALGPLLGEPEASRVFERAVTIAGSVPIYRLETAVGLDRLGEVVEQILEWHGAPGAARMAAGGGM